MAQLQNIEAIEKRLWSAADNLRANSNYASNEYFLTQFADLKAHDGGEFFTPVSLVQMIANVIKPDHGKVLDPACGSGGMFVQSAHFVERLKRNPSQALTFYGMEKNPTTIRLAKMNLAVHGLEGDIQKAISYYEDPHELAGKADFVMANPPSNVDEVDADKIKNDPRLPFGLPGVNKSGKVSNGNYLWISYFHSYLGLKGRAGFVMSSQASSAGRDEANVRQKLVESGDVDVMIELRPNFFYTRTVPCELWFLGRGKPKERRGNVLMLDARGVYRKVTRKIYDFSPEQLANLTGVVWLYRGQTKHFLDLVKSYLARTLAEAEAGHELLEQSARLLYREWFIHLRFPGHEHVTVVDGVPKGWWTLRLNEVAEINAVTLHNQFHGEIEYIDIASVTPGRINDTTRYSFEDAPGRARRVVRHGDIIWSCVRPNRESHAVIWNPPENLIASTGFAVISPTALPTSYLHQVLTTREFVGYLSNNAKGVAYPAVTARVFEDYRVSVPPAQLLTSYDEQVRPTLDLIFVLYAQMRRLMSARDLLLPRLMSGQVEV